MRPSRFSPSPFFSLRAPLLPFETVEQLSAGARAPAASDPLSLAAAVEADAATQRGRLKELLSRPEVREAVFLASPDLDQALDAWTSDPASEKGRRAERALVKYVARMASRATPFGLFAGTGVGLLGQRTRLAVEPRVSCRRRSRLDVDYVFDLADALAADGSLRERLAYRPNATLYPAGDRLRYVERGRDGGERTYRLVGVEGSPELSAVLARAGDGATLEELAAVVVGGDVDADEARRFVEELVEAQLLVPDLGLSLTGPEPPGALAEVLRRGEGTAAAARTLHEVARELRALDEGGLGASPAQYRELASRLSGLPVEPELSRLFQVDLVRAAPNASLGERVLEEARRGVELLHRLTPPRGPDLALFREAFEERYGQREVPLVEALDEESGIGYPAHAEEDESDGPLVKGIGFPSTGEGTVRWGPREAHLLRRLSLSLSTGEGEIVLEASDLDSLANSRPAPLPGAFAALFKVAAASDEALDRGDFRVVLESAGGPSGARFLGRFCHADPELARLVAGHLRAEEALVPDAVFAEVVHLPEGRSGNVVARPLFREYEVPYLGVSGAPPDRQLPASDLLVSVRREEIVLRSRRLGRRVVPRLTAAHNYVAYGLCLYRFLCALQAQGTTGAVHWDWGALSAAPFLPRVRHGRVVLSSARWNLGKDDVASLAGKTPADRFAAVAAWRARRKVPRFVLVAEMAEELLVDLDSVLSVEAFVHLARQRETVELKEMLPSPGELCARGEDGRYVHEVLLTYEREPEGRAEAASRPAPLREAPAGPGFVRTFAPGSEWLAAKLYGGAATLDRLLRERLGPLVSSLVRSRVADRWFFVRYADPRPHIRLRLHGDRRRLRERALRALEAEARDLLGKGLAWRLQLDTYEREVERYGGPEGILLAEEVFHRDSEAVIEILGRVEPGAAGEEERWRLALLSTDVLLRDLGHTPDGKRRLVEELRTSFFEEHGGSAELKRAVGERHRSLAAELRSLLGGDREALRPLEPGMAALRTRSARLAGAAEALRKLESEGRLGRPASALAASFVHMNLNRVFPSAQRRQEWVVYELLSRTYAALAARPAEGDGKGCGSGES